MRQCICTAAYEARKRNEPGANACVVSLFCIFSPVPDSQESVFVKLNEKLQIKLSKKYENKWNQNACGGFVAAHVGLFLQ